MSSQDVISEMRERIHIQKQQIRNLQSDNAKLEKESMWNQQAIFILAESLDIDLQDLVDEANSRTDKLAGHY